MKKYNYLLTGIGFILLLIFFWIIFLKDARENRLMKQSQILIEKIEDFRKTKGRLPNSLYEIGIKEEEGIDVLYYDKRDSLHYTISFGTSLGESMFFYSDTKQWEDKYGFVPVYQKGVKGQYQLVVEKNRWKQLKAKLKEATRKTTPMSFEERVQEIKQIQRGWINNFRLANIQGKLLELDGWLRNHLRYCIWHHWNRACELTTVGSNKRERKQKNLIRLGVSHKDAFRWSRSRLGGWAIAQSPILNTTITVDRLIKRGYEPLLSWYKKVAPDKFTPTLFPVV